jgi:hypothetical protein
VADRCQLLYLSRLAADTTPACVAEIIRTSRLHNRQHQLDSVLVFDGWRFCQYLEGEVAEVCELVELIRSDIRHTGFKLLHQGLADGRGLAGGHGLVYALCYDDSLDAVEPMRGHAALERFAELLPTFDLEPGVND